MKPGPRDLAALVLAVGASGSILILVTTVALADGIVAPWLETLISAALGTFVGSVAAYLGGGRGEHTERRERELEIVEVEPAVPVGVHSGGESDHAV